MGVGFSLKSYGVRIGIRSNDPGALIEFAIICKGVGKRLFLSCRSSLLHFDGGKGAACQCAAP